MKRQVVLVKLGGSLITDKSKPLTIKKQNILTTCQALAQAIAKYPEYLFVIGNGAGSYGHFTAHATNLKQHPGDPMSIAKVHQSVATLNAVIVEQLIQLGVPAISMQPSAFLTWSKNTTSENTQPLLQIIAAKMTPIMYGDILPSPENGSIIISTERVLQRVADALQDTGEYHLKHAIFATSVEGVFDDEGKIIPRLGAQDAFGKHGILGFDTTGGMADKIQLARTMRQHIDAVTIAGGLIPNVYERILDGQAVGTAIEAAPDNK